MGDSAQNFTFTYTSTGKDLVSGLDIKYSYLFYTWHVLSLLLKNCKSLAFYCSLTKESLIIENRLKWMWVEYTFITISKARVAFKVWVIRVQSCSFDTIHSEDWRILFCWIANRTLCCTASVFYKSYLL